MSPGFNPITSLRVNSVSARCADKNTSVALYVYDAIIFDFSKQDGKEVLEDISKIISENNKYPVKFKYNNNLLFTD